MCSTGGRSRPISVSSAAPSAGPCASWACGSASSACSCRASWSRRREGSRWPSPSGGAGLASAGEGLAPLPAARLQPARWACAGCGGRRPRGPGRAAGATGQGVAFGSRRGRRAPDDRGARGAGLERSGSASDVLRGLGYAPSRGAAPGEIVAWRRRRPKPTVGRPSAPTLSPFAALAALQSPPRALAAVARAARHPPPMADEGCRVDVWLWRARFCKTRALAAAWWNRGASG